MKSNLDILKACPIIVEAEKLDLVPDNKSQFESREGSWERALEREKLISIYRFKYLANDHKVVGFLAEPKSLISEIKKLPAIIYNRGGNANIGQLTLPNLYGDIANFAKQGYIIIATQYSGVDGGEGKDEMGGADLNDVLTLKQILEAYPFVNTKRIGMIGASRGGLMTYLSLAQVDWLKAAIAISAPSNLIRAEELRPEMIEVHRQRFGGNKEELIKRSAYFWPEKFNKSTPLLILHGTSDKRVDVQDSIELGDKLKEQGVSYELKVYEGASHGLPEFNKEYHQLAYGWFEKYLKN
jgi:dipeptidyl aminopeptidase/acylaminoacyl peptidase